MANETLSGLPTTNMTLPVAFIGQPPGPNATTKEIIAYNDAKWNWQHSSNIIQDYLARAQNAMAEYQRTGAASAKSAADDFAAKAQENIQSLQRYTQTGDVARYFQPVSSSSSGSIPFKQGLTPAQQQSIQALLTNKSPDQWNATDKANWSYATNNAPIPSQQTNQQNQAQNPSGPQPAPQGNQPSQGTQQNQAQQRQQWVDDLYKKYFDRSATDAEMANWQAQNPQQLETFLQSDAKKYGYTSTFFQQQQTGNIDKANQLIDSDPNLTPEMKALAKQVVASYKGGIEADAASILKTFDTLKSTTIDPHYADLIRQAQYDLKSSVDYLRLQRATETQQEAASAQKQTEQAIAGLEATGKTFSGEAVKQLGATSAYTVPFGGQMPEGTLPQQQRLIATSSQARYLENLRQLGQQAEQTLGTSGIGSAVPGYTPIGGVGGSIASTQQKEYAQTLQELAQNQQSKTNLGINTQPL